jgi:hypothetical protein
LQIPHFYGGSLSAGCWALHRIVFPVVSDWYQEYVNIRLNCCPLELVRL